MESTFDWNLSGSYYEVCNCEAICPCRRSSGKKAGRPTYENCDFAISWWIKSGRAGDLDLAGLKVVMVGRWERTDDDPWHVTLYVDERATPQQKDALAAVFLGRAGGHPQRSYATNIIEVHAVKSAAIELDHARGKETIDIAPYLHVKTREIVPHEHTVSCGIPGHDHPGQEIRAEIVRYQDAPYDWDFRGKCGFATEFTYSSQD